jgi:primosomal protein N' (replication factor Y)
MTSMYVEVAVNLPPIRGTFHYHIPDRFSGRIQPGQLVIIQFGNRRVQGIVMDLTETSPVAETKPVEDLVDPQPVLTGAQLELAQWMSAETMSPLSDCLHLMLPRGLSRQADSEYALLIPEEDGNSPTESRLLDLIKRRGPLRGRQLQRAMSRMAWKRAAENLVRRGVLSRISVLDPPGVRPQKIRFARLAAAPAVARERVRQFGQQSSKAAARRRSIINSLIAEGEPLEVTWIYAESGGSLADLRKLEDQGLIALSQAEVWRDPLEHLDFVPSDPPTLTTDQSTAWEAIRPSIGSDNSVPRKPFLLHGVTGSGKTEIYLRAVSEALESGLGSIILVPEIALTPQTVRRFLARFPGQVGLIHSQLSDGERYDTWRRCRSGELKIVVGPRSALFTPMPEIGLIVLDESHDGSYKESTQSPRYHARDTAIQYAEILGATCILGSATPDVVTTFLAENGILQGLSLPRRILGHRKRIEGQSARLGVETRYLPGEAETATIELPSVRVVDMRNELRAGNRSLFSRPLQAALKETLDADQQAILFLNRRGSSTYVFCRDCGEPLRCPRCETPLTFHSAQEKLRCHHCAYQRNLPTKCPNCGSTRIKQFGAGTQAIDALVKEMFPAATTLRWDRDTTRRKGAHEIILAHFSSHRADVLVGTQMIAKGLDLPLVTLVGVVSADTGLNLPDYRAAERTFQILTQVAGRAGRGLLGGRVILQTYQPEHYAVRAASKHDYQAFYAEELARRQQLEYPPYSRLARLLFKHHSAHHAEESAKYLAGQIEAKVRRESRTTNLIGPVPAFFQRLRGDYRWQIIIRGEDPARFVPEELPEGWIVDIDPISLL